jgi:hypothetical protein
MKKNKLNKSSAPCCVFCGKSSGVQFTIFYPKFQPFGTACVECEKVNDKLPEKTLIELVVSPL